MPPAWLATLESIILKMPNRFKSEIAGAAPVDKKNEYAASLIQQILAKFPAHKRVLFFQSKFNANESLTAIEIGELEKFHKLLLKEK